MLYDNEEMLRICEKYGIETIEKEGAPLYLGKEMTEDFSFEQMMREPCVIKDDNIVTLSENFSFTIHVHSYNNRKYNDYHQNEAKKIDYTGENSDNNIESHIQFDSVNILAA